MTKLKLQSIATNLGISGSRGHHSAIFGTVILALLVTLLVMFVPANLAAAAPALAQGVLYGTNGVDNLKGSAGQDVSSARGGADHVGARAGSDIVSGGSGSDAGYFTGGLFGDSPSVKANSARDGDDTIIAEEYRHSRTTGKLFISKNPGKDMVMAGSGNDQVYSVDGRKDSINCGRGQDDIAVYDKNLDKVSRNCETRMPRRF